jgi:hypothetical protein
MFQQRKLLKDVLSLSVNRHKGMALIERVESSDLSAADRAHVSCILRTMLRLPDAPGHEPFSPEASAPSVPPSRHRQRRTS